METETIDKFGGYSVKGVKTFKGTDWDGFNATLYKDGKKIALLVNDGGGGCLDITWLGDQPYMEQFKPFEKDVEELRPIWEKAWTPDKTREWETEFMWDTEIFVDELINDFLNKRYLKNLLRKKVCFQVGDEIDTSSDEFRTLRIGWKGNEQRVRDWMQKTYPNQKVRILNEEVN
jgi:hypothetical protein